VCFTTLPSEDIPSIGPLAKLDELGTKIQANSLTDDMSNAGNSVKSTGVIIGRCSASNGSSKDLLDKHVKHYTKNEIEKYAMGMFNVLKPGMITPDVMEYLEKNNFDLRAIIAVEEAIIKKVQPPDNGNMKPVGRNISRTINSFEGWVRCMLAKDESTLKLNDGLFHCNYRSQVEIVLF
jgi:hypothetical protein